MSFCIIIRKEAEKDIVAISRWYESKEPGLGNHFLLCLDATFSSIKRNPTAARIIRHEYRRAFLRRFPVGVYYLVEEGRILIDLVDTFVRVIHQQTKEAALIRQYSYATPSGAQGSTGFSSSSGDDCL